MKTIKLKSITLRNFKGIKDLHLDFESNVTNICGENKVGKTTIFDAWSYVLFGKDSKDREKFDIIPLDKKNRPLEKVDNEVSAVLEENGAEIELRRVHHQKWVKKRGSTDVEYAGNETLFYYNGVPQKASEYKQKIDSIMDEGIFKLVTNPLHFNSLHWQDRREILTSMAGKITTEDITARLNGRYGDLVDMINKGKPIEEYRQEVVARKRKIKDDLSTIPTRIDEIQRGMPEGVDVKSIQKQIDEKQKAIDELDEQIADVRKQSEAQDKAYQSLRESRNNLRNQADDMRSARERELRTGMEKERAEFDKMEYRASELDRKIESLIRQKKFEEEGLKSAQVAIEKLREDWKSENSRRLIFDEERFRCPTCKRDYPADDIEKMKAEMNNAFTIDRQEKLDRIDAQGKEIKGRIEKSQAVIKELESQIRAHESDLAEVREFLKNTPEEKPVDADKDLEGNKEYQGILASIKELDEKLSEQKPTADISSHQQMKHAIISVLDDLKKQLNTQETIDRSKARIKELEKQEKDLSQQLADLEKEEFAINEFIVARTNVIEEKINDKFSMVRFKMFDKQINGAVVETCEALIEGVPFSNANNGARVNAGLDIINALCDHYGVSAPIFVDNRESLTSQIETRSQLINLVVTKDKKLTIKS